MKRFLGLVVFVLLASPAFAQDVDFGAFSDLPAPSPGAPAARGAVPARGAAPVAPPVDRLVRLRDVLLKAEAPLTKEQETALNGIITAEIPVMRQTIQAHGQQMIAARPPIAPVAAPAVPLTAPGTAPAVPTGAAPAVPPAAARGAAPNPLLLAALAGRGASPSSRVPAEVLDALEVEMRQMNDALFSKISSAPALDAKQKSVLTRMSRDQIKSRGGFDALRISMEDASAPFTEDQVPKVQAAFDQQKEARAALAKESQGTPDPARLKQLERETLTKVVGILTPAQRTALLAVLKAQQ